MLAFTFVAKLVIPEPREVEAFKTCAFVFELTPALPTVMAEAIEEEAEATTPLVEAVPFAMSEPTDDEAMSV